MRNSVSKTCIKIAAAAIVTLSLLLGNSAFAQHYQRTNLTVDRTSISFKATLDPNLVNAWGLSRATGSPFWISDNNAGVSTLYRVPGANNAPVSINQPLAVVNIPSPGDPLGHKGTPTGAVFNLKGGSGGAFQISNGVTSAAAHFRGSRRLPVCCQF